MQKQQQIKIGVPLRAWQKECIKSQTRFNVFAIHRRAGKTELALLKLIDSWLNTKRENSLFGYVGPQRNQTKNVVWRRLKTLLKPLSDKGLIKYSETDLTIDYKGSPLAPRIQLFGADHDDAIRGNHFDGLIVDEVANIRVDAWEKVLRPTLSDKGRLGWCTFIGTPSGHNLFYDVWQHAQDSKLPQWSGKTYTVYQTDAIDPDEIEELKRTMSAESFAQELLCDWEVASATQFISLTLTVEARRRACNEEDLRNQPLILGVDVARFGDDSTVIYPRRGLQALQPLIMQGANNMEVASRLANIINDDRPDAVFIDGGGGAGVIDRLRQLGFPQVIEVQFGGRASDDGHFKNRRAEMWNKMRDWLNLGGALSEDRVVQELCIPQFEYDPVGRLKLESKSEIKKRLKRSPDSADALALTFSEPVYQSKYLGTGSYRVVSNDYNPLDRYDEEADRWVGGLRA